MLDVNAWNVIYESLPFFLTRDEQAQVSLLCDHVIAGEADQVLVSGISGLRVHSVGSDQIASRLGKSFGIEAIDDPTEARVISFLKAFAQDIRADGTRKRIRFVATAPQYLSMFLADLDTPCKFGLYLMGFDARSQQKFTHEWVGLLTAWCKRVKAPVCHCEGIVDAGNNHFLFDTRRELRRALDAGEQPTNLFLAALERRDGQARY
jgi:hypothetical protein